jgi:heme A synthase
MAQMTAGIAALMLGTPAGLSILHQLGGIFVLAGAFVLLRSFARAGER